MLAAMTKPRDGGASDARARTLRRMQGLLVASTVVAACTKKDGAPQPGTANEPGTPGYGGGGYGVVDPLPAPVGCSGVAAGTKVVVEWKRVLESPSDEATWVWAMEMTIILPAGIAGDFGALVNRASEYPPRIALSTRAKTVLHLLPKPNDASGIVTGAFVIPVHCDPRGSPKNGSGALSVSVAYAKPGERIESPSVYDE
jgi:hypothetical protein